MPSFTSKRSGRGERANDEAGIAVGVHVEEGHTAYEPNRLFVDEQIEGPFASWVHRHEFEAVDASTTRLTDHVTFTLPGGTVVNALLGRLVALALVPMFRFRRAVTTAACEEPAATTAGR